jgi:hypothetical protein
LLLLPASSTQLQCTDAALHRRHAHRRPPSRGAHDLPSPLPMPASTSSTASTMRNHLGRGLPREELSVHRRSSPLQSNTAPRSSPH